MFPVHRREAVLALAVLAASGCMVLGGTMDPRDTTRVESAEIASANPTLAAFVLRIAVADVTLDGTQSALASDLARASNRSARPIEEARTVFIEELVRAVDARQFSAPKAVSAAEAVVKAAADAGPELDADLAKLHASLEPWQRRRLEARVRARFDDWSREWRGGTVNEHPWLASIGTDQLASSAEDTRRTTRRWAEALLAEVRAGEKLDEKGRRDLVALLRQAGPK